MRDWRLHFFKALLIVLALPLALVAQVGPQEVVDIDVPVFSVGDVQSAIPMIALDVVAVPDDCFNCLVHIRQFRVVVSRGARQLIVELANISDPSGDLDLVISKGTPITEDAANIYADYAARGAAGLESITLPLDGDGPLEPGEYYIGVVTLIGEGATFEIRGLIYADADAPPQTTRSEGTYCDATHGYAIDIPLVWKEMDASELAADELAGFRMVGEGGSSAVFKISSSSVGVPASVEDGYELAKEAAESSSGYVFLDKSNLTVGGEPAIKYSFQRDYAEGPATVVVSYWHHDDAEWIYAFACHPVQAYPQYADAVNRMLSSFRYVTDCDGTQATVTPPSGDLGSLASSVIRSMESGLVTHGSGAQIEVPAGAVPQSQSGGEGEMLFTIEKGTPESFGVPATPPHPNMVATDAVYDFGPSGFILAEPIRLTLPVPEGYDPAVHTPVICRYDPTSGRWGMVGGVLSDDGRFIEVDTIHLSFYSIYLNPISRKAWGALEFSQVTGYSAVLCIDEYTLKYPELDGGAFPGYGSDPIVWIPRLGSPGSRGRIRWLLPQGTYRIGVTIYGMPCPGGTCTLLGHYFLEDVIIDTNSSYPDYAAKHLGWQEPVELPDLAPCRVIETASVGVGEINVRLEWNAECDLDLWVVDPSDETISYNNTSSASGGQLDLDNRCSDFVLGRPENIFWAADPPRGTYKVYVDYYSDCSSVGAVTYKVTWYVGGTAYSRTGTISPPSESGASDDEILVTEFTF
jgi:hypothetical protein